MDTEEEQKKDEPKLDINDMRDIAKGAYWLIGGLSFFACLMIFFISR